MLFSIFTALSAAATISLGCVPGDQAAGADYRLIKVGSPRIHTRRNVE